MPTVRTIRLHDGRELEYARCGNPRGLKFLFNHGLPGSCAQACLADPCAEKLNIDFIAPNRPGFGASTYDPYRTVLSWRDDVAELAQALGFHQFNAIMGCSGGAAYALTCARDARVVGIVSGLGPLQRSTSLRSMRRSAQMLFSWVPRFPHLSRIPLSIVIRKLLRDPIRYYRESLPIFSDSDRNLITHPAVQRVLIADVQASLAHGTKGFVKDIVLQCQWGFELEDLPGERVLIWHGREDRTVPLESAIENLIKRIPACTPRYCPGGHFMIAERFEEIVQTMLEHLS